MPFSPLFSPLLSPLLSALKYTRFTTAILALMALSSFSHAVNAKEFAYLNEQPAFPDTHVSTKTIFIEKANGTGNYESFIVYHQPEDTDRDGVVESLDACPNSPKGIMVDATGCDIDFDRDGVENNFDACPTSPIGHSVNEVGC